MPGLLATESRLDTAHALVDIAVAHRGLRHVDAEVLHRPTKPQIRHHRAHHDVVLQLSRVLEMLGEHRHQNVTVGDLAVLVHSDEPIGVSVESEADPTRDQ